MLRERRVTVRTFHHISSVHHTMSSPRMSIAMQSPRCAIRITAPAARSVTGGACAWSAAGACRGCGANKRCDLAAFGREGTGCSRIASRAVEDPSKSGTAAGIRPCSCRAPLACREASGPSSRKTGGRRGLLLSLRLAWEPVVGSGGDRGDPSGEQCASVWLADGRALADDGVAPSWEGALRVAGSVLDPDETT